MAAAAWLLLLLLLRTVDERLPSSRRLPSAEVHGGEAAVERDPHLSAHCAPDRLHHRLAISHRARAAAPGIMLPHEQDVVARVAWVGRLGSRREEHAGCAFDGRGKRWHALRRRTKPLVIDELALTRTRWPAGRVRRTLHALVAVAAEFEASTEQRANVARRRLGQADVDSATKLLCFHVLLQPLDQSNQRCYRGLHAARHAPQPDCVVWATLHHDSIGRYEQRTTGCPERRALGLSRLRGMQLSLELTLKGELKALGLFKVSSCLGTTCRRIGSGGGLGLLQCGRCGHAKCMSAAPLRPPRTPGRIENGEVF